MSTHHFTSLTCPSCGGRLSARGGPGPATPYCPRCPPRPDGLRTQRPADEALKEVWCNLSGVQTWGQVVGLSVLLGATFFPVLVLWGADRLRADEPLLPWCVGISMAGGAAGMALCYPKKGYWLPGVIAGPLFGPGVYLAFWLLAGEVMNKLVFLGLVLVGGTPSFALYMLLLLRKARQGEGPARTMTG